MRTVIHGIENVPVFQDTAFADSLTYPYQMQIALGAAAFDDIYAFTGLPETVHWEKPNPAMVLEAAQNHQIDLTASWLIGDADRDIVMAQNAGVGTTVRVRSHHSIGVPADHTVGSVAELPKLLACELP